MWPFNRKEFDPRAIQRSGKYAQKRPSAARVDPIKENQANNAMLKAGLIGLPKARKLSLLGRIEKFLFPLWWHRRNTKPATWETHHSAVVKLNSSWAAALCSDGSSEIRSVGISDKESQIVDEVFDAPLCVSDDWRDPTSLTARLRGNS